MKSGMRMMNDKDLRRLEVVKMLGNKEIKHNKASDILGIGTRQTKRLLKAFRKFGLDRLISKHQSKKSNRSFKNDLKNSVITLVRESYPDFVPTFAAEKLLELNNLKINKDALRQ